MAASLFKWLICGILLSGALPAGSFRHPLYVCVTQINHNIKDKTLEISVKMFTNDFETVLEKGAHTKVDLNDPAAKKTNDQLVAAYVAKHLQLKADGKALALQYLGYEKENDGTWSYFQVSDIPTVKRIDASNSLLYDGFDQQINIMHVTVGGNRKSTRLNYPDMTAAFEF